MCNLYSMTKNVDAIRRLFGGLNSRVGNLPSMPGIFPDYSAPIVRNGVEGRLRNAMGSTPVMIILHVLPRAQCRTCGPQQLTHACCCRGSSCASR